MNVTPSIQPAEEDVESQISSTTNSQADLLPSSEPRLSSEADRISMTIEAAATFADDYNSSASKCLRATSPLLGIALRFAGLVGPLYIKAYRQIYSWYLQAPGNVVEMVFGLALCFFGGTYAASIAAIEAFRLMGWTRMQADILFLADQATLVVSESKKDDALDDDHDGIADVQQISKRALVQRKLRLGMLTVTEPHRIQLAVASLWSAYVSVLATLRLEFARTTALALGLAEMLRLPATRALAPPLAAAIGADLKHWVGTIIDSSISLVAIVTAWYLQAIVSAFYSALRGGKLFAHGLFCLLNTKGWIHSVPFVQKPFDPDASYLDEVVAYGLFALGFGTQLLYGFGLSFPFNLLLLPLTAVEWILRWQITLQGAPSVEGGAAMG